MIHIHTWMTSDLIAPIQGSFIQILIFKIFLFYHMKKFILIALLAIAIT